MKHRDSPLKVVDRNRHALSALGALALCAFLFAPSLAYLVGIRGGDSKLENRTLYPLPAVTLDSVGDGSFGKAFSDWFWDALPLRPSLLRLDHALDHRVFRDSPTPREVVWGKDGFAFRVDWARGRRGGAIAPSALQASLRRIRKAFEVAGLPVLFVISPSKASIYPDKLPDSLEASNRATVEPTIDAIRALRNEGFPVLDLWHVLAEERRRLERDALTNPPSHPHLTHLFRPTDEHWNVEAGRLQAKAIVDLLRPGAWDETKLPRLAPTHTMVESELSSIYLKLGILEPYRSYASAFPTPTERTFLKPFQTLRYQKRKSPSDATRVVLLRDSFLSGAPDQPMPNRDAGIPLLAAHLDDIEAVHWRSFTESPQAVREHLADVEYLIVQISQTNLSSLRRNEALFIEFAAQLRKRG